MVVTCLTQHDSGQRLVHAQHCTWLPLLQDEQASSRAQNLAGIFKQIACVCPAQHRIHGIPELGFAPGPWLRPSWRHRSYAYARHSALGMGLDIAAGALVSPCVAPCVATPLRRKLIQLDSWTCHSQGQRRSTASRSLALQHLASSGFGDRMFPAELFGLQTAFYLYLD